MSLAVQLGVSCVRFMSNINDDDKFISRKRGNCECIAIWGHPSHANTLPLWLRRHAKFEVAEPIHCRIIACLLLIHYFTLWPWPLTFDIEHLQCIACDVMKLCKKFERNRAIRGGFIAISVFDLMTLNTVLRVALGSGIIVTTFDIRQLIRAWIYYSVFWCWYIMSRCDLDLWSVDFESSWYIKRHVIKVCTKFKRNREIPGSNYW